MDRVEEAALQAALLLLPGHLRADEAVVHPAQGLPVAIGAEVGVVVIARQAAGSALARADHVEQGAEELHVRLEGVADDVLALRAHPFGDLGGELVVLEDVEGNGSLRLVARGEGDVGGPPVVAAEVLVGEADERGDAVEVDTGKLAAGALRGLEGGVQLVLPGDGGAVRLRQVGVGVEDDVAQPVVRRPLVRPVMPHPVAVRPLDRGVRDGAGDLSARAAEVPVLHLGWRVQIGQHRPLQLIGAQEGCAGAVARLVVGCGPIAEVLVLPPRLGVDEGEDVVGAIIAGVRLPAFIEAEAEVPGAGHGVRLEAQQPDAALPGAALGVFREQLVVAAERVAEAPRGVVLVEEQPEARAGGELGRVAGEPEVELGLECLALGVIGEAADPWLGQGHREREADLRSAHRAAGVCRSLPRAVPKEEARVVLPGLDPALLLRIVPPAPADRRQRQGDADDEGAVRGGLRGHRAGQLDGCGPPLPVAGEGQPRDRAREAIAGRDRRDGDELVPLSEVADLEPLVGGAKRVVAEAQGQLALLRDDEGGLGRQLGLAECEQASGEGERQQESARRVVHRSHLGRVPSRRRAGDPPAVAQRGVCSVRPNRGSHEHGNGQRQEVRGKMNVRGLVGPGGAVLLGFAVSMTTAEAGPKLVRIGPEKKVIEWGWDEPSPAYMRANAESMDGYGFDGVIFHAEPVRNGKAESFAWSCWTGTRFGYEDFARDIADLQAAGATFRHMTDNFLRFNVTPGDVDWFDDEAFAAVTSNAELAGRVAKEGGCQGLMFDIEMYGRPLFTYAEQARRQTKTFAEYEEKVRQRGQELMRAFNRYYPDITVLLTYGYEITGVGGDRSQAPYGLLKDLLDGMFEAAAEKTIIVDAYEGAYSFRAHRQFAQARQTVREGMLKFVGNPRAYRKHVQVGFGVWMDNRYQAKDWFPDDFERNTFTPEEFEYSVFCGLDVTDRYVWVYTEHPKWWTNEQLPPAYWDALRGIRTPRPIDDAKYQGRQIKGLEPPPPPPPPIAAAQPGYSDEATFGDLRAKYDFVADLPKVWEFRTDPGRVGERERWFAPEVDLADWRGLEIGKFWDEQGVKYTGDAWYRLTWVAPTARVPQKARLILWFGAVDETATVWVNGVRAGAHREPPDIGWDKRFAVDVTGKLKLGQTNTIAVKVGNSTLAGGIWKSVRLAVEKGKGK